MDLLNRIIAITDLETTGLDAHLHEIIEIGLVLINHENLEVIEEWEVKVKPVHIETAAIKALEINGYNSNDWIKALDLAEAMKIYSQKTREAVFLAHNTFTDWSFIVEAFKKTGIEDLMDYHRLDLFSIAWSRKNKLPGLKEFHLSELCRHLNVLAEPLPHRALNGARVEYGVLKKLLALE